MGRLRMRRTAGREGKDPSARGVVAVFIVVLLLAVLVVVELSGVGN